MAGHSKERPGRFAFIIAAAIKREMGEQRMSGRSLATRIGKSEGYVRERMNGKFEFTLNDVENFCLFIGVDPEEWIGRVAADELLVARLEKDYARMLAANPRDFPEARSLREVMEEPKGRRKPTDVGGSVETLTDEEIAARYGDRIAADRSDPEQDLDDRTP